MSYISFLEDILKLKQSATDTHSLRVLDLFAGAGGLSLGFEANGFNTVGYELNKDACHSYNANLKGNCYNQKLTVHTKFEHADVIIGGPPCQPFSHAGKNKSTNDDRDGFPLFISAINQVQPKLFLFENVKNLTTKHQNYFNSIINQLSELNYTITWKIINTKNYGIPQNRERLIVVGTHKQQMNHSFNFPVEEFNLINVRNAFDELINDEEYIYLTAKMDEYILKYEQKSKCRNPRDINLDSICRTVTCKNLASATSDMLRIKDSSGRRMLTIAEAKLLQSFPLSYQLIGSRLSQMKQIGNAVPPLLSYYLAKSIKKFLKP